MRLNAAYEVKEQRSWWQVTLTGAGLTIALAVLGFTSLVLLFYSRKMEAAIMQRAGISNGVSAVWQVAQWPILAVMLLIAFALLYRSRLFEVGCLHCLACAGERGVKFFCPQAALLFRLFMLYLQAEFRYAGRPGQGFLKGVQSSQRRPEPFEGHIVTRDAAISDGGRRTR
jgi:hypothetical protein